MPRCIHLHDGGTQCVSEVLTGREFCEDHGLTGPGYSLGTEEAIERPFRKVLLRVVAFLLLLLLLIPFYRVVRVLYSLPLSATSQRR